MAARRMIESVGPSWTVESAAERLQTAWGVLRRTPIVASAAGALEPLRSINGHRADLGLIEWTAIILGQRSEERVFLLRHLQWIWEGKPVRRMVDAGAPVWQRRRMSWSAYCRKRREILEKLAGELTRYGVPPPLDSGTKMRRSEEIANGTTEAAASPGLEANGGHHDEPLSGRRST